MPAGNRILGASRPAGPAAVKHAPDVIFAHPGRARLRVGAGGGLRHHAARPPRRRPRPASRRPPRPRRRAVTSPRCRLRDKLAQLLMVGVTDADDARTSSTTTTSAASSSAAGRTCRSSRARWPTSPPPRDAAVGRQRRRGGRPGVAAASLIGAARRPGSWRRTQTADQVHELAARSAARRCATSASPSTSPPSSTSPTPPDDTVIGDRSFGGDPDTVTAYAGAYAQGLRDAGLLPVLKHFPGHGHGSGDSHTGGGGDAAAERAAGRRPGALPDAGGRGPGRGDGRAHAGSRADRRRTGQPEPRGGAAAAQRRRLRRTRRSTARCSPTTCRAWARSPTGTASPRRCCAALQAGADVALWVTTDEVPAVLDRLQKAVAAGELPRAARSTRRWCGWRR